MEDLKSDSLSVMHFRSGRAVIPWLAILSFFGCHSRQPRKFVWKELRNPQGLVTDSREQDLDPAVRVWDGEASGLQIKIVRRPGDRAKFEMLKMGIITEDRNFYEGQNLPYRSAISRETVCPKEFRTEKIGPTESETEVSAAWPTLTNDRFVGGICDAAKVAYRNVHGAIFCKQSNVTFEINLYEKVNPADAAHFMEFSKINEVYRGFTCS